MKSLAVRVAVLLVLFSTVGCQGLKGNYLPKLGQKKQEQKIMFVVHASGGSLDLLSGSQTHAILTLNEVNSSVSYFTDRPNRDAGTRSLADFLNSWNEGDNSFANNPPNAALVYYPESTNVKAFSEVNVILKNPHYNPQQNQLIFEVTLIDPNTHLPMGNLSEATLFIDGAEPGLFEKAVVP